MTHEQIRYYLELYRDLGWIQSTAGLAGRRTRRQTATRPAPATCSRAWQPEDDTLDLIRLDIGDCRRCRLCESRNSSFSACGNERSPLVFVGEGPGADEDAQGIPFVGRAGQLLTQMIENTAAKEGFRSSAPIFTSATWSSAGRPRIARRSRTKWKPAASFSSAN